MSQRQQAHELIDRLTPDQLAAVVKLLQVMMLDPVSRPIASAPVEEEPETDQERQAVAEADEWLKQHQPIPSKELLSEFGLTIRDVRDYKEPV